MSTHAYTENKLVEQPAIGLFAELGWQTMSALEETFGATVPLFYENRTPELQLVNPDLNEDIYNLIEAAELDPEQEAKLERELSQQYHILTRDDQLETVAQDIVRHFLGRGFVGKAMVVSIDSYGRAIELLRPTGAALEIAAGHYAEAVKILGRDRIIEAAHFFVRHIAETLPDKTVAEVADELIAAKHIHIANGEAVEIYTPA
jgi:type I site-specific restriction-modification system R (restriction) subunit